MAAKKISIAAKRRKDIAAKGADSKFRKTKAGRIVSKSRSDRGKKLYTKKLKSWTSAVQKARRQHGITGFVPVGGKSAQGKKLYATAKKLHSSMAK